jgi:hypothetical protein
MFGSLSSNRDSDPRSAATPTNTAILWETNRAIDYKLIFKYA